MSALRVLRTVERDGTETDAVIDPVDLHAVGQERDPEVVQGRLAQVVAPPELGIGDGEEGAAGALDDRDVELVRFAARRRHDRARRK